MNDFLENPYSQLGVRSFINCCGTRTIHSGTLMFPQVTRAMEAASNHFVNMDELMEGVGRRIASLLGAEWAIVTSGGAASLCHATAACVVGADPEKLLRLPNTEGLKNRVIMLVDGRFTYDQAIRTTGIETLEVATLDQLAESLDDTVALVALLGTHLQTSSISLQQIAERTRPLGIPILVDAASEPPCLPNPYLSNGATMVSYSGGKYLRGPQCSGILLGEESWVRAAWTNAAPHHALGRPMKVGKEEIMGLLAAVEHWASTRDLDAEARQWDTDLLEISDLVSSIPAVTTRFHHPANTSSPCPRLEILWDGQEIGITGLQLRQILLDGEPRIMADDRGATDGSMFLLPFSLQPGEARIVGERISSILSTTPHKPADTIQDHLSIAGKWKVQISFLKGSATHHLSIIQDGTSLSGQHQTLFHQNPLTGSILGNHLNCTSQHRYEGTHIAYRFIGTADDDRIEGSVELGSTGQSAPGPLNQQEYGTASFTAIRVQ